MPEPGLNIVAIDDPEDPRVAAYRNLPDPDLRRHREHAARGLFMAEGELVVRTLIRSGYGVVSVLLTQGRLESIGRDLALLPIGTPIYLAGQGVMDAVAGFHIHRGILACGVRPEPVDVSELLGGARRLVVMEAIANHDNMGGIFRNIAALGGAGAAGVLCPRCCDPLYRKAIRVSIGHVLSVPFARARDWPGALDQIRGAGFTLIGLSPGSQAEPIGALEPVERPALVLGSEGAGLSEQTRSMCDCLVRIPMAPGVDSLNVVVAAGIALHRLVGPP